MWTDRHDEANSRFSQFCERDLKTGVTTVGAKQFGRWRTLAVGRARCTWGVTDWRTDVLRVHEVSQTRCSALPSSVSPIKFRCVEAVLARAVSAVTKQISVRWAEWVQYQVSYATDTFDIGFFHEMKPKRKIFLNVRNFTNKVAQEEEVEGTNITAKFYITFIVHI